VSEGDDEIDDILLCSKQDSVRWQVVRCTCSMDAETSYSTPAPDLHLELDYRRPASPHPMIEPVHLISEETEASKAHTPYSVLYIIRAAPRLSMPAIKVCAGIRHYLWVCGRRLAYQVSGAGVDFSLASSQLFLHSSPGPEKVASQQHHTRDQLTGHACRHSILAGASSQPLNEEKEPSRPLTPEA
jgi:hypothetical protein